METRRLYRSRTNRMIGGVAGGISQYLNIDATLVRLAFALLVLANGFGALLYLLLWLLIPAADSTSETPQQYVRENVSEMRGAAEGLVNRIRDGINGANN